MHLRGIRGATTAEANTEDAILNATQELLHEMVAANRVETDEIAAIVFTCSPDLDAAFPAEAARQMHWTAVPLLSATEVGVPGSVARCIRVLMLWNTPGTQSEIVHRYLRGAAGLRPDLRPPQRA
jgi:chorismate mutase